MSKAIEFDAVFLTARRPVPPKVESGIVKQYTRLTGTVALPKGLFDVVL